MSAITEYMRRLQTIRPDLGSDVASKANLDEAITALEPFKARGYRIFTIGLGPDVNVELLNRMSAETGAPPTWIGAGAGTTSDREEAKKLLDDWEMDAVESRSLESRIAESFLTIAEREFARGERDAFRRRANWEAYRGR